MHRDEDAGKIEGGGQNRPEGHFRVGDVHILGHEEGGSAHNGGHDLPAGGGGGLNSAGKLPLIAGFFHHRDGDRAGGDRVAHGGAGHHAAEGGGDDRHLGGAAGEPAYQGVGQINEEGGDAGALQESAEDDEHHDVLGADLHRGAHNAVGGVEQLIHDALHADAHAHLGEEGVEQQGAGNEKDGQTHAAAAQLHQGQQTHNGDDHLQGVHTGEAGEHGDQGVVAEVVVQEAGGAQHHNNVVIPGDVVVAHMVLAGGIDQIAHDHQQGQERGQAFLQRGHTEQGGPNAVQGEEDHDHTHDDSGRTFPDAGVGLLIVFAHQILYVLGGTDGIGVFRVRIVLEQRGHSGCSFHWDEIYPNSIRGQKNRQVQMRGRAVQKL